MKSDITIIYYPPESPPIIACVDECGLIEGFDELDEEGVIEAGIPKGLLAVVMIGGENEMSILESFTITKKHVGSAETKTMMTEIGNTLIRNHTHRVMH